MLRVYQNVSAAVFAGLADTWSHVERALTSCRLLLSLADSATRCLGSDVTSGADSTTAGARFASSSLSSGGGGPGGGPGGFRLQIS